jgi:hypothetical protein
MTSPRLLSRPDRAHRTAIAASIAVVALALTACRDAQPRQAAPTPTNSTPAVTTTTPAPPPNRVFGKLTVTIAKTTSASVVPRPPISYRLGVRRLGEDAVTTHPIGADGEFALALATGTYEVVYLEIDADDLSPTPVQVPLTATERLRLRAPATGCIYGGHVQVLYGRVVSGTRQRQTEIVQKLANANQQNYGFIYLPNGGLIITGAKIDIPAVADRPEAVRTCTLDEFASAPI